MKPPTEETTTNNPSRRERIIDRADRWGVAAYGRRLDQLRGVGPMGLPEDNEASNLLTEGYRYGTAHGRGEAGPLIAERARFRAGVEALHDAFGDFDRNETFNAWEVEAIAENFANDVLALIDGGEARGGDDDDA